MPNRSPRRKKSENVRAGDKNVPKTKKGVEASQARISALSPRFDTGKNDATSGDLDQEMRLQSLPPLLPPKDNPSAATMISDLAPDVSTSAAITEVPYSLASLDRPSISRRTNDTAPITTSSPSSYATDEIANEKQLMIEQNALLKQLVANSAKAPTSNSQSQVTIRADAIRQQSSPVGLKK